MKKKYQKMIDEFLNGDIGAQELDRLLKGTPDEKRVREEIAAQQEMIQTLSRLPQHRPEKDLAAEIGKAIEGRASATVLSAKNSMWKLKVAWATSGVLIGVALTWGANFVLKPQEEPVQVQKIATLEPSVCRVRKASGEIVRNSNQQIKPAEVGERLLVGDALHAGQNSKAEIDVDSDAGLVLHSESGLAVRVLEDRMRTFGILDGRVSVDLLDGGRRAVLLKTQDENVIAEGRIGSFSVMVSERERMAFGVLRGSVMIHTSDGQIVLAAGKQLKLSTGRPATGPEPLEESVPLVLSEPSGPVTSGKRMILEGKSDSHARVWIGGERVHLDPEGRFHAELDVAEGDLIEVLAEDWVGNTTRIEIGPIQIAKKARSVTQPPAQKIETKSYKVIW